MRNCEMKKALIIVIYLALISGCSAMQKQADGRYFKFSSNNNSEASIWLERVIVDGKWNAPVTGTLGCSYNFNGGGPLGSVSNKTPAPKKYIYLEWYAWREMARMKARVELPNAEIIRKLLLNPPWHDKSSPYRGKSLFIVDFRSNHKVWIKLAKDSYPETENEVMILAEGQGIKTNDVVKDYIYFEKGEDYQVDCIEYRKETIKLGGHVGSLKVFDKWYTEFIDHKEKSDE